MTALAIIWCAAFTAAIGSIRWWYGVIAVAAVAASLGLGLL